MRANSATSLLKGIVIVVICFGANSRIVPGSVPETLPADERRKARDITANARLQLLIEHARSRQPVGRASWLRGAAELQEALDAAHGKDDLEFSRQLAYFLARHHDESDQMFIGSTFRCLQLQEHMTMYALDQYLQTDDPDLRLAISILIDEMPECQFGQAPVYKGAWAFLRESGRQDPPFWWCK